MSYFIRRDYTPRLNNYFDDERGQTDACQDEVYKAARALMDKHNLQSVLDVGTGSGFKLLKYFGDKRTMGIDQPSTIEWVKTQYPLEEWDTVPFDGCVPGFDLVIAADIIEHLVDPDQLLKFIIRCKPKWVVISTPNRDNLQEHSWAGPPRNPCHVREWSAPEFRQYMNQWFEVQEHNYPDPTRRDYSTMYVVGVTK